MVFASAFLLLASNCNGNSLKTDTPDNNDSQVVLQSETNGQEEIQEFYIDNCDGKANVSRVERRSSSVDASVSTELAAKIGARAEVVSAEVQASVGTALQLGNERETSIELVAPPNTHMYFKLAWIGRSQIGIVQNVKSSGIPVAFQAFTPTDVRIKEQFDIGCTRETESVEKKKTWDELISITALGGEFTGEAWFCQAKTNSESTTCYFGALPPKPGCYLVINKDWTEGIDVEDTAIKLGAKFIPSEEEIAVNDSSGYGCGVPRSNDYWLLWNVKQ